MMEKYQRIALIVPCFNEEENVAPFVAEVECVLAEELSNIFITFVDDGSTDGTVANILALQQEKPFINLLKLSRNFGKEAAVTAALDNVDADAYAILDVDLQHPLEAVVEFINVWKTEGVDNIYGMRNEKHLFSIGFYSVFNKLSGRVKIPENVSDFRLIDRRVVDILRALPERNRFMKGLFAWGGLKSKGVPYVQKERHAGSTKFNYPKLWNFALDGILGFSTLPLRVWTYFGAIAAFLAFLHMLWVVAKALIFGADAAGYPSLMSATLFFGGVQLVSIGILGEYLGRVQEEVKRRPVYVVSDVYGEIASESTGVKAQGSGIVLGRKQAHD